jgi:hypothetical protein
MPASRFADCRAACWVCFAENFRLFSFPADPLANDPEAKKVKDWRHKLQRGFLGKSTPTEDVSIVVCWVWDIWS